MTRQAMLRIIALPLRRPAPTSPVLLKPLPRVMTYYEFQLHQPKTQSDPAQKSKYLPQGGIIKWVQNKAGTTWAGFGQAQEGSWKLKLFQYGERVVDRIDFEELALKGIDPSLGPSLSHPQSQAEKPTIKIPLIHPSTILSGDSALSHLKSLVEHRIPKHRKLFWVYMIVAPLTAPFMIVPVIPNIPFFFCVWRSWSHYRAYKASEYLQSLLLVDAIVPEANKEIEAIYHDYIPKALPAPAPENTATPNPPFDEQLLLTRDAIPAIRKAFNLESTAEADIHRALEQARVRQHGL